MLETTDLTSLDPGVIQEEKLTPQLITCKENHYFDRMSSTEVKCRNCPLGYYLTPGMEIKDGHVWIGKQLMV